MANRSDDKGTMSATSSPVAPEKVNGDNHSDLNEDEDEPLLKYKRIVSSGQPEDLLYQDTASCIAVGEKLVAVGTHGGTISIHDLEGNSIRSWAAHGATVNALSLDRDEEFIGSASDDGQVMVHSLVSDERTSYRFLRPMKCIALHPTYRLNPARPFVAGGMAGDLILSERGWLGKRDTVLHSGEGPVFNVQWCDTFIAWACDTGVKIYDTKSQRRITSISRAKSSPHPEFYPCQLFWKDSRTLFIGWADSVKVVLIKERSAHEQALGAPALYAEITAMFQLDAVVCGLAPFRGDLLVLAYDEEQMMMDDSCPDDTYQARTLAEPPTLRVINYQAEEVACDLLTVHGYELYQAHDYRVGALPILGTEGPDDRWFYIMSPKDIICAKPRDWRDRMEWMLERQRYGEALEILQAEEKCPTGPPLETGLITSVGEAYLEHLLAAGDYAKAGKICSQVLRDDAALWEKWVFTFAELNQLQVVSSILPTESPRLSNTVYEMVLAFWLTKDLRHLTATVRTWPPELYNIPSVITAVEDQLQHVTHKLEQPAASPTTLSKDDRRIPDSIDSSHPLPWEEKQKLLMETLVVLYTHQGRADKVIEYSLRLYKPGILDTVVSRKWISELRHMAVLLLDYDQYFSRTLSPSAEDDSPSLSVLSQAPGVQLLVRNYVAIPPQTVVGQLRRHLYHLHVYLHALYLVDSRGRPRSTRPDSQTSAYGSLVTASAENSHILLGAPFHDLQVELYAEYDYTYLLRFLRSSSSYRLEHAFRVCEARDMVPEMVYLLGRMGDSHQALQLILRRLHDVPRAIEFAREQNDPDLWEELLHYAQDQPEFVTGLLEQASTYVDPVRVLKSMKPHLEVPDMKRTVIHILLDLQLQVSLRRGCEKILGADCIRFSDQLRRAQRLGTTVHRDVVCLLCQHQVFPNATFTPTKPYEMADTKHTPADPGATYRFRGPSSTTQEGAGNALAFFCGHVFHDTCVVNTNILRRLQRVLRESTSSSDPSGRLYFPPGNGDTKASYQPLAIPILQLLDSSRTSLSHLEDGLMNTHVRASSAHPLSTITGKSSTLGTKSTAQGTYPPESIPMSGSEHILTTKIRQLQILRSLLTLPPSCPVCHTDDTTGNGAPLVMRSIAPSTAQYQTPVVEESGKTQVPGNESPHPAFQGYPTTGESLRRGHPVLNSSLTDAKDKDLPPMVQLKL
ncbi:Vacuolar protein sorting-associated protein 41 [Dispira parvispora]|uniref:Vacuolar protein sorting-associated protein 41 n=1 Tax=Dispira parvispora TaxID=1520584 RepID=A0A9W8ATU7_9FUNG|nr:Vacuolar protein sorting-associated protein 41 [Dispira parvispora]